MPYTNEGHLGGSFTGKRTDPATMIRLITPSSNGSTGSTNIFDDGACRGISAASSGTVTFYDHTTTLVSSYPLRTGENPVGARQVLSTASTLTTVAPPVMWALY